MDFVSERKNGIARKKHVGSSVLFKLKKATIIINEIWGAIFMIVLEFNIILNLKKIIAEEIKKAKNNEK